MTTEYYANRGNNACSVEGCDRPFRCGGYCKLHYDRMGRYGSTELPARQSGRPSPRRRPQTETHAYCSGCDAMLPWEKFGPTATKCRKCVQEMAYKRRRTCPDCGVNKLTHKAKQCRECHLRECRETSGRMPLMTGGGYIRISGYQGHPNAHKRGTILEHKLVMSEMLGRPLLPGEQVHHKNGVRHDNRPENLELWVVSQPSGQRPADLVAWAKQLLSRYEPDALVEPMLDESLAA